MSEVSVLSVRAGVFEADWNLQVQELVALRRSKMSQSEIAEQIGVSLKSIQRFENYRSHNIKIMYHYKLLLK